MPSAVRACLRRLAKRPPITPKANNAMTAPNTTGSIFDKAPDARGFSLSSIVRSEAVSRPPGPASGLSSSLMTTAPSPAPTPASKAGLACAGVLNGCSNCCKPTSWSHYRAIRLDNLRTNDRRISIDRVINIAIVDRVGAIGRKERMANASILASKAHVFVSVLYEARFAREFDIVVISGSTASVSWLQHLPIRYVHILDRDVVCIAGNVIFGNIVNILQQVLALSKALPRIGDFICIT